MAKKISELDTATIPLTGGELIEMSQAGVSVKVTSEQMKDFANVTDLIQLTERGAPSQPGDGEAVIFMSDGTGGFTAGDVICASGYNDGEGLDVTYTIIHDHSAGTNWPGG